MLKLSRRNRRIERVAHTLSKPERNGTSFVGMLSNYIMNRLCRSNQAKPLSTIRYPLKTASATPSPAYIVFIETLIRPVKRLA